MADYATTAQLRAYLRIPEPDTQDTYVHELAITAASNAIDAAANREFGLTDPATEKLLERYWDKGSFIIWVPDISSTDNLVVAVSYNANPFSRTFDTLPIADDFIMLPETPEPGFPYTNIRFRKRPVAVKITAEWGWAAIPPIVENACLLQASRFVARRESPYGIAGSPQVGSEMRLLQRLDPDVALMLSGVRRWYGAV